jgi:hypothetical protein
MGVCQCPLQWQTAAVANATIDKMGIDGHPMSIVPSLGRSPFLLACVSVNLHLYLISHAAIISGVITAASSYTVKLLTNQYC